VLGLDLGANDRLVIHDDDGVAFPLPNFWLTHRPPIQLVVRNRFTMVDGSVPRLVLESDPWDSLISFQPGIPVTLGGTLRLDFTADVELHAQIGRTIRIFDWTGVSPIGRIRVQSPYVWDLSRLHTVGDVRLIAIPESAR